MKQTLRKLFWPILKFFESDEEPANYQKSHRVALLVLGSIFLVLSIGSMWAASSLGGLGAIVPIVVFFSIGLTAVVIGTLGSDAAVAKIWGTK